ncbi:ABC transporter substrate-binding protein [Sporichthya polymorpha]|uniref:ABC transporter substrate-binding protein n=1 Tax=Sporichthya polymorpha TaxID=35751 RepID=UPI000371BDF4|nr:ABC transporter substrate-binding protein [Sporichthya polymorpha]
MSGPRIRAFPTVVAPALASALALVLLAGCGTRLTQDELVAMNGGTVTAVPGSEPGGAPSDISGGVPGAVPADPGAPAVDPNAAAPGAQPGATPAAGGTAARPGTTTATTAPGTGGSGGGRKSGPATAALKTDNKPLTVCSVSELGGPAGAAFAQGIAGLQSWVGDVNSRGGVAGHKIRVVVKDSNSDPNVALAHARTCVENEGAVALVGSLSPLSNRGMQKYLESKGVPSIGGDCGSSTWNDSPVFFNQCPSVESNYWMLAYEAARAGTENKKLGFLYCQEAQTCAEGKKWWIDNQFPQKNGLELAYSKQFSLTQLDFTSECSAMKSAGVTVVMAVVDPSGLQRMGQSCARQGYNPVWSQPYASVYPDTPKKAGLGNIVLSMPVMPFDGITGKDAQNPTYQRYLTAYQRYGDGKPPGPSAVIGFTAGLLFERFVTEVAQKSPSVTSAALLQAASGIKKETLGGAIAPANFTTGEKTPDSKCWFLQVARDGGAFTAPNGLKQTCRK